MPENATLLAIAGGTPVLAEGPPSWPLDDDEVRAALAAAMADGSWGKYDAGHVAQFSAELAQYHGAAHALPCCSGTFAVEFALRAVKVGPEDEVILAGYDFPGNFRAVEACGARPVLVDIEPQTWCLDAAQLEAAFSAATKAVVVSHLHGGVADMQQVMELCRARSVAVVEDACQTPGGEVQGRVAGMWGDVGVLSFGGSKLLTAGRGGAILTNDAQIAQRARIFCERGNHAFPLSELQAAVLCPQLRKLDAQNAIRRAHADRLRELTNNLPGLIPVNAPRARGSSSYYKFAWRNDAAACGGHSRDEFVAAIQAEGVAIDTGFRGFAGRSASRCRRVGELPHSRAAAEQTVILHHPVLLTSHETIERVAAAIRKVLMAFTS
jgi:dTDP-4-amino-4,6-dideoxygalactose transaminase